MTPPAELHTRPDDITAALAAWDDYCAGESFRPESRYQYRSIATRFLRWLEPRGVGLGEITLRQVEDFLDDQDVLATTRVHYRSMLRRFFDALVARGLLPVNSAAGASPKRDEPSLTLENLPEQFSAFSPIEKQATVDAASFALLHHDIWLFTEGQGGARADVDLCEATIKLGERNGITPFAWFKTSDEGTQDVHPEGSGAPPQTGPNDSGETNP